MNNIKQDSISEERAKLKKLIRTSETILRGDARAQERVKALNTLLNSGHNLRLLDDEELENIWESIFFALWYAEMGRGCEQMIAAIQKACSSNFKFTRIGMKTIAKKWYGLDKHRVDKISHLARHLLSIIINLQVRTWFRSQRQKANCKKFLKIICLDTQNSYGLCYFILENLAEEISTSCSSFYSKTGLITGRFSLKANLIVFLYEQVISFSASPKLDPRLIRTFDHYVIRRFISEILSNEAEMTQLLIRLRLHETLKKYAKKGSHKSKLLLDRWSNSIKIMK